MWGALFCIADDCMHATLLKKNYIKEPHLFEQLQYSAPAAFSVRRKSTQTFLESLVRSFCEKGVF